jgi:hypothetical protein
MDDYEYDNDNEFLDEYKAVERAGYTSKLNELVVDINNPTPDERFLVNIYGVGNAVIQDVVLNNTLKLTYNDLDKILEKCQYLSNKRFKNPTAFILGYICIKDGKIDKKIFNKISDENILNQFQEAGIQAPDILRYARFLTL